MPGPWEKYQQNAQPAPAAGPWAKYASPPQAAPVGGDMRALTPWENLTSTFPIDKHGSFLDNVGAFGHDALAGAINTVDKGGEMIKGMAKSLIPGTDTPNPIQQTYDAMNTRPGETLANAVGQSAILGGAGKLAAKPLVAAGEGMQNAGAGVMNRTVGTYASDFDRGANPGRAYLDAGNGPSLSMQSIANKAAKSQESTGAKLGSVYADATKQGVKIPVGDVRSAIDPLADNVRGVVTGPGGTGDTAPIDQFRASFNPPMDIASANGGFTPTDLWGVKKNVAQNTNWSDPTQVGMKQLRQQTTGAIGSTLTDHVPDAKPLNSQYQGLFNMTDRADMRAKTGSSPLGHMAARGILGAGGALMGHEVSPMAAVLGGAGAMALDSVPVKTSLASALYHGGKGAVAVGNGIKGLYAPPVLPAKRR